MTGMSLALSLATVLWVPVSVTAEDGVDSFYIAVGAHYDVPKAKVVAIRRRDVADEHLPVVFYLAHRARVSPDAIVDLRLGGKSWMEITAHLGLTSEIFHVPVTVVPGPPYGKALGHFKNKKRGQWAAIQLADSDVTHLVHLRFLSARHGCSPDAVIKLRQKGDTVVKLNGRVKIRHGKAKLKASVPGTKARAKVKSHGHSAREGSHGKASKPKSRGKGAGKGKGRKK